MTKPVRIVDAHVHLWDPARTDWYPYLSGGQDIGMETTGMARRFDVPTYREESAGWAVEAIVNVAAATGRHSIDETLELDRRASEDADVDGRPDAIVGGLPPTDTPAEAIAVIEQQQAAPRFRGVRPMGRFEGPLPAPEVLRALAERNLVFEVMSHPDQLQEAAAGIEGIDDLTVVVEHTGWPRSTDEAERALWAAGIDALASVGPNVVCKLSGLAMPLGSMEAAAFAPWLEHAIGAFGPERCMFASNFPVDGMHGTFDQLWSAFDQVTAGLGDVERDLLFAGTAARTYRL
jgi:predicted TIM-barrel fold metal-dependent hydrolase